MWQKNGRLKYVIFGIVTLLLFLSVASQPLWAASSQTPGRQTVPPTLEPKAYLPLVINNVSWASLQSGSWGR